MQCVILSGGLGTRVKHLTGDLPKALLPIGTDPFIIYQLKWLKILGITEAVLLLAHKADKIESVLNEIKDTTKIPKIKISYDGATLCGTGGAIARAAQLLENNFIVTYGDSFLIVSPQDIMNKHLNDECLVTLSIYKNMNHGDKSNISLKENGLITYKKNNPKIKMDYIDYGMMALHKKEFLEFSQGKEVFDLATYLEIISEQSSLGYFEVDHPFYEVGSEGGYNRLNVFLSTFDFNLEILQQKVMSKKNA